MDLQRINDLIEKYTNGTATKAERKQLIKWYRDTAYQEAEFPEEEETVYQSMLDHITGATSPISKRVGRLNWSIAASILVLIGAGTIFFLKKTEKQTVPTTAQAIQPGGNKAILTLANGSKISLTDAGNGAIAEQNGVQISKTAGGQLVYRFLPVAGQDNGALNKDGRTAYNTIETPIGGQYRIELPDGSKVWLNSVSSIKFPVSFASAAERKVELKGEGYFEVKHNEAQPFRVSSGNQMVEDIGTEFNIQAYGDEPVIKTTLISGSARVNADEGQITLKPGEQVKYNKSLSVAKVNLDDVIAWKNGYFSFEDENLEDIMKVISRWYNIHYIFQDQSLKKETYGAVTTRFTDINSLLDMMEQTGNADFKIEGSNITITRKRPTN